MQSKIAFLLRCKGITSYGISNYQPSILMLIFDFCYFFYFILFSIVSQGSFLPVSWCLTKHVLQFKIFNVVIVVFFFLISVSSYVFKKTCIQYSDILFLERFSERKSGPGFSNLISCRSKMLRSMWCYLKVASLRLYFGNII